jgi:putative tryptophan/tyrosine transport system substrate-binding protein
MQRRDFIMLLGCAAAAWPVVGRAQLQGMPVVGFLRADTPAAGASAVAAFSKGLSEIGFVEGRNLAIEFCWAQNDRDRIRELAADLIHRKVSVIAAPGSAVGALAAKALTTTIPIVFSTSGDPTRLGLVASLNRPGGNVTGIAFQTIELAGKQFGLFRELLPRTDRFAALVNPNFPAAEAVLNNFQDAAARIGMPLEIVRASADRERCPLNVRVPSPLS